MYPCTCAVQLAAGRFRRSRGLSFYQAASGLSIFHPSLRHNAKFNACQIASPLSKLPPRSPAYLARDNDSTISGTNALCLPRHMSVGMDGVQDSSVGPHRCTCDDLP